MFKNKKIKAIAFFLFFIGSSFFINGTTLSQAANAAAPPLLINDTVYKNLSAHQHYYWLNACFEIADIDKTTKSEVDSWDFFQGDNNIPSLGAMYGKGSEGVIGGRNCSTEEVVKRAFNYLGFDDSRDVFCSIPGKQYDGKNIDKTTCLAGDGGKDWDNNKSTSSRAAWFRSVAAAKKPNPGSPGEYLRSYLSLVQGCNISFVNDSLYASASQVPQVGDGNKYAVPVVIEEKSGNKSTFVVKYIQGVKAAGSDRVSTVSNSTGGSQIKTCNELVNSARDTAAAYAQVLKKDGYNSKQAADKAAGDTSGDSTGDGENETSCAVDGIGWIICPVMSGMAKLNSYALDYLKKWLTIPVNSIGSTSVSDAWKSFRDIANVLFVIAFMIIIYSQIVGGGRK